MPSIGAVDVVRAIFDNWTSHWGAPIQLHSDRGSSFVNQVVAKLCQVCGIQKTNTTAYHPQANGQTKRTNRSLKGLLKAFTNECITRERDLALTSCLLAYRAAVHLPIRHKSNAMLTGREVRLLSDIFMPFLTTDTLLSTEYARNIKQRAHPKH
ncbi:unnamed protein product [Echinostoma caproni]|uniref:Integrase catalytic domain-containing protein n=1 Tax=Echinostoma caproni TaxID=27848 RepID=A0A183A419_9TREM|nr:unnamed protein product [Echinostoma caproni]